MGGRGYFVFLLEKNIVASTTMNDMTNAGTTKAGLVIGINALEKSDIVDAIVFYREVMLQAIVDRFRCYFSMPRYECCFKDKVNDVLAIVPSEL